MVAASVGQAAAYRAAAVAREVVTVVVRKAERVARVEEGSAAAQTVEAMAEVPQEAVARGGVKRGVVTAAVARGKVSSAVGALVWEAAAAATMVVVARDVEAAGTQVTVGEATATAATVVAARVVQAVTVGDLAGREAARMVESEATAKLGEAEMEVEKAGVATEMEGEQGAAAMVGLAAMVGIPE